MRLRRLFTGAALLGLFMAGVTASRVVAHQQTFRASTTFVTTDVIARDASGRFIADLTQSNFVLLEDGQPQRIDRLTLVQGGRRLGPPSAPAPPAAPEGVILPSAPRASEGNGRFFLILVDDLHIEAEYTPHVRRLVQTLASTLIHDGDMIAVASTGPSSIEVSGTYDRSRIAAAASRIRGSGITATEVYQLPETSQGAADLRRRALVSFQTAYRLVSQLDQVRDRRKAVLYISSGYDLDPFLAGRQGRDRIQGGRFSDPTRILNDSDNPYQRLPSVTAAIDLHAYLRELTLTANRVNASLYPVDPRGLSGVVDAGQFVDQSEWRSYLQRTQSSLRYLAEQTGGFAVVNVNDFASQFTRIDAETSDYYLIGYYSTNTDVSKRVRTIDVRVDRPGAQVTARAGYSLSAATPR